VVAKEPGNKTWGGGAIRPGRSASPRVWVKHGGPMSLKDRRQSADTVSWLSNVVVVGVVTSGKRLVNLTGEVPLRPSACESSGGKPTYKSPTKAEATRQDMSQRLHPPCEFSSGNPGTWGGNLQVWDHSRSGV